MSVVGERLERGRRRGGTPSPGLDRPRHFREHPHGEEDPDLGVADLVAGDPGEAGEGRPEGPGAGEGTEMGGPR
jgi:hypothetical protein